MLSASRDPWLDFWYEAFHAPSGIVLAVSDVPRAVQKLYQARAKSGDPDLQGLQIRRSPVEPNKEIWLLKSAPKKESSGGTEGNSGT